MDASIIALTMAVATGSAAGMRPYLAVLALGLAKLFVPAGLSPMTDTALGQVPELLADPVVLIVLGALTVIDAVADKIPYLDSVWDSIHTVIRPLIGGAVGIQLGVGAGGGDPEAASTAMTAMTAVGGAVAGGGAALTVHTGKAALRAVLNLLPEPVTNWLMSFGEDVAAVIILVSAIILPPLAGILAVILIIAAVIIGCRIRRAYGRVRGKFSEMKAARAEKAAARRQGEERMSPWEALREGDAV